MKDLMRAFRYSEGMQRSQGRTADQLRKIKVTPAFQKDPTGSVLIEWGNNRVICSVFTDEKVPNWMGSNPSGWITAEYGMLPGSSDKRIQRDKVRQTGRTHEIQRLIGRSLRACVDPKEIGMRTYQVDCDVLQADGGTRVASITGAYLALRLAFFRLKEKRMMRELPNSLLVGAVSLGKVKGELILDLDYSEDVAAEVDANVVMNEKNEFIEIQGTAEKDTFKKEEFIQMMDMAQAGCRQIFGMQKHYIQEWGIG